jgi:hypothetical protein
MPYRPDEDAVGLLPDSRQATHCWNDPEAPVLLLAAAVPVEVPVLADEVPELSEEVPVLADAPVPYEVPVLADVPVLAEVPVLADGVLDAAGAW